MPIRNDALSIPSFWAWIAAGGLNIDFALQVDQLTIVMLLVAKMGLPIS